MVIGGITGEGEEREIKRTMDATARERSGSTKKKAFLKFRLRRRSPLMTTRTLSTPRHPMVRDDPVELEGL